MGGFNNNRNKGKDKNSQSGNNSASNPAPRKKCNYCGKFRHSMEDYFARKDDNLGCYNT